MSKALVEGKYFRVCPISKVNGIDSVTHELDIVACGIKDGLAIEKRREGKGRYCAVAFVKPLVKKLSHLTGTAVEFVSIACGVKLEDVGFRTIKMMDEGMPMEDFWEMMQEYKNCVNFARQAILDSQEKK